MHDRDIRLTDEEQRIIAEIERHERARRSPWRCWRTVFGRRPATRTQSWRRARWWTAVLAGTVVLGSGLVTGNPIVGLAGYLIVLHGMSRMCRRMTHASSIQWFLRLIGQPAAGHTSDP